MIARLLGLDRPVLEPEQRAITAWGDWGTSGMTAAGITVTMATAEQLLAVYGSTGFISDQISTMPFDVYRRTGGSPEEITRPSWLANPTTSLDFVDWCGQVLWSMLMDGNAYCAVMRASTGTIGELVPLDPTGIEPKRVNGFKVYDVGGSIYPGEILHIKARMRSGSEKGISPLEAARQTIGIGLAAQEFGAGFYSGEGNMPGVIEIPGKAQPDQMTAMAEAWRRKRTKAGRGLPGVLESGASWKPTGVTPEQAQALASRQWTAAEIAGQVYLLDPTELGIPVSGTTLTYANAQDRKRRRYDVTLKGWVTRIENAVSSLLASPRYMKFNLDAYLRGDTAERYGVYEAASRINTAAAGVGMAPFFTTGEMRDLEDLPPVDAPIA